MESISAPDALEGFLDTLHSANALEDLQACTEDLRNRLKVAHIVYHWVNAVGERFGAGTYSQDWVDRYLEMDYLRMDPVIFGCLKRFHPTDWKELDWTPKAAKAFLKEAIQYGVGNQGYTVPIRGPKGQFALFTISDRCDDASWASFRSQNTQNLILIAHAFNARALALEANPDDSSPTNLSPRELGAMTCLAKGMNRAQAASEMDISEHTLRVYIESARHKLGALNTTHAVARALSNGLIIV
jgi:DNA-binding CsgD family transcriptional regulator